MLKSIISHFPYLQIIAIAGRNIKMKERFDDLVKDTNSGDLVKILSFTNQVPELMSVSDLVITKPGGLTTTESLASGLPISTNISLNLSQHISPLNLITVGSIIAFAIPCGVSYTAPN